VGEQYDEGKKHAIAVEEQQPLLVRKRVWWIPCVLEKSADAVMVRINVIVPQTTDLALSSEYIKKHKYLPWFLGNFNFIFLKKETKLRGL
jgi:hypothetical protein